MDSVHVDSHTTQLPAGFEGKFEISASSSDAEPRLKVGLKEQLISGKNWRRHMTSQLFCLFDLHT